MHDAVLEERLARLRDDLSKAENLSGWWQRNLAKDSIEPVQDFWESAIGDVHTRAAEQRRSVSGTLQQLASENADADLVKTTWQNYGTLYEASHEIFRDCLEVVGGLAFRLRLSDSDVWQMADELVNNLAKLSARPVSLTLPAPEETVGFKTQRLAATRTMARLTRLRFPDWSVSALPLVAYEYGRVVITEYLSDVSKRGQSIEAVRAFLDEQVKRLSSDADRPALDTEQAQELLHVLMADAFATYTLGPAYPCAAILLRLNPALAYSDREQPCAAQRAETMLNMLEQMDEAHGGPYTDVTAKLRKEWAGLIARAGLAGHELKADEATMNKSLVRKLKDFFYDNFGWGAEYPTDSSVDGWLSVQEWTNVWRTSIRSNENLGTLPVKATQKIRDVLNAAWLLRLENLNDSRRAQEIQTASVQLWKAITDKKKASPQNTHLAAATTEATQPAL